PYDVPIRHFTASPETTRAVNDMLSAERIPASDQHIMNAGDWADLLEELYRSYHIADGERADITRNFTRIFSKVYETLNTAGLRYTRDPRDLPATFSTFLDPVVNRLLPQINLLLSAPEIKAESDANVMKKFALAFLYAVELEEEVPPAQRASWFEDRLADDM